MPAKDHAAWDRLPVLPPLADQTSGLALHLRHARARTAPYELALASPTDAAALKADHERRLRAWAVSGPLLSSRWFLSLAAIPCLFAGLGISGVFTKAGLHLNAGDVRALLWSLAPAVIFLILVRSFRNILGPRRRLAARRCPDCAYDLAGSPPGLNPAVFGTDVGPRQCPECGSFWPLVPPAPLSAT